MSYTHIVVGAGSAGCVLAEGLSAHPGNRVLLIEAGPDYAGSWLPPELEDGMTPAIGSHDWNLWADIGGGRRVPVPRGRVVGGTSQINSCIALRPEPSDFDGLAVPLWGWERMAQCLEEIEDDLDFPNPNRYRGPLRIHRSRASDMSFPARALVDACVAAGYPYAENHNAPFATGVGPAPLNISPEGVRISSRLAFLEPARGRGNLDVLSEATVERVVLVNGRTEGIEYHSPSRLGSMFVAARMVVLAAGAYGSPVILQRSGVGPRALLESLGIPVVVDLPGVGANLSDHAQVPLPFSYEGIVGTKRRPCVQALLRYTSSEPGSTLNDMQLCMINHVELATYDPGLAEAWDSDVASSLTANLMVPRTRGSVRLGTAADGADTVIEYGFVDHPADLARLREGVRMACSVLRREPFAARITRLHRPTDEELMDDRRLDAWIVENFQPGYHPIGTARIGGAGEPGAVVDDHLRVLGTAGLYVADASVLPAPLSANTNLAVMAVARNAVRMLGAAGSRSETANLTTGLRTGGGLAAAACEDG